MNLRSNPYGSYRTSNNEWVDQTPSEWQEKRVKDLFRLVTDKASVDNDHELLSLYASIGVRPRKDLEARGNKASSTDGYWLVKKGDIVVNKLLAWMGAVGLSEYDGVTSPAYDVLRKTSKLVDVRYFSYLFRTDIAKQIFKRNSRGIMDMRLRLYFDKLGAITVPVPPFSTQQAIATYIDTKTAQIDRQIDLFCQKATQYGKLKQSLIDEVVVSGLVKSQKMKNSGLELIGEVPEHWGTCRLKEVGYLYSGLTGKSGDDFSKENEYGEPFIPFTNIASNFYLSKSDLKLVVISPGEKQNFVKVHDLFFLMSSEGYGDLGKCSLLTEEMDKKTYLNSFCKGFRFTKRTINPRYVNYLLHSSPYRVTLSNEGKGFTRINLRMEKINDIHLLIPSVSEQQAIAAYLDIKTAQIDRIIDTINSQIKKLKDVRKALINDVVTGKINVVSEGMAV